jgi:hypothetical protein
VAEALWALGLIAGPAALRRLAKMPQPAGRSARRHLAFSRALIAHRYGLASDPLPPAEGPVRRPEEIGDRIEVTLTAQDPKQTAADAARLLFPTYGIALARYSVRLTCGAEWTIFFTREMSPATIARQLPARPWILGLAAGWHRSERVASVRHVLLSRPEGGRVRIDAVRPDGVRTLSGHAVAADGIVTLTLGDIDRPGTLPAFFECRIGPRGLEVEQAVVSRQRVGVRTTTAVRMFRTTSDAVTRTVNQST